MSQAIIRRLFETALADANLGLDIAYENIEYVPVTNKTYLTVALMPYDTFTETLKGSDHTAYVGLFQIKVVTQEHGGVYETDTIIEQLRTVFTTDTVFNQDNFWVQVVTPISAQTGRLQNSNWVVPCYFEYRADTN